MEHLTPIVKINRREVRNLQEDVTWIIFSSLPSCENNNAIVREKEAEEVNGENEEQKDGHEQEQQEDGDEDKEKGEGHEDKEEDKTSSDRLLQSICFGLINLKGKTEILLVKKNHICIIKCVTFFLTID